MVRKIVTSSSDWSLGQKRWGTIHLSRNIWDLSIGDPLVSFCDGYYLWSGLNKYWIIERIDLGEYDVLYTLHFRRDHFKIMTVRIFIEYNEIMGVEFLGQFYHSEL